MILIRILSENEAKIETIAKFLLQDNLAIDINIKRHLERLELKEGELVSVKIYMITAKTKSLLFPIIEKRLRQYLNDELPEIYALPITNMDWSQAEVLSHKVQKI